MNEKEMIEHAVETKTLLAEMLKQHDKENKRLWVAVLALLVALGIMAGCMVWTVQNAQRVANEAVLEALNTVADMEVTEETTTTTTTQTVEGDSATINNKERDMVRRFMSQVENV